MFYDRVGFLKEWMQRWVWDLVTHQKYVMAASWINDESFELITLQLFPWIVQVAKSFFTE